MSDDDTGTIILIIIAVILVIIGGIWCCILYNKSPEELPIRYSPLIDRWIVHSHGKFKTFTDDTFDCCWIFTFNVSFFFLVLFVALLAIFADVIIIMLIIIYDVIYGLFYSILRCMSGGKFKSFKQYFVLTPETCCDFDGKSEENGRPEKTKTEGKKTETITAETTV
eukprot:1006512_1